MKVKKGLVAFLFLLLTIELALAGTLFELDLSSSPVQVFLLSAKDGISVLGEKKGTIIADEVHESSVNLDIFLESGKINNYATLSLGQTIAIDLDRDQTKDIFMHLEDIKKDQITVVFSKDETLLASAPKTTTTQVQSASIVGGAISDVTGSTRKVPASSGVSTLVLATVTALIVLGIGVYVYKRRR